jgi:molybdopterin synthase catalytic subunit
VGEPSVIIAVSSAHRADSLEACAFAIDTVKAQVPIWKREVYEGDSTVWKENKEWRGRMEPTAARTSGVGSNPAISAEAETDKT